MSETRDVTVEGSRKSLAQDVRVGNHRLASDEPVPLGGGDTGPTPYELLLAALGACTSMTLHMYAQRKGWPLEQVKVTLHHDRVHAKDCADCETKVGKIDHLSRHIHLEGPLDSEQRHRLLEIANKCPVHRTLSSEIRITSSLV